MSSINKVLKPAVVPSLTLLCRARRGASGGFVVNFHVQAPSGYTALPGRAAWRAPAEMVWCGSRRLLGFANHAEASFGMLLPLPTRIAEGDSFPITLRWDHALAISATVFDQGERDDGVFELSVLEDESGAPYVCAEPALQEDRPQRDVVAAGACPVPARQRKSLGVVQTLRALPDVANLTVWLRRDGAARPGPVQVRVLVGEMRRLAVIAENQMETTVGFPLAADGPDTSWPLVMEAEAPVLWAAEVFRGVDGWFQPAFTLADA